MTRIACLMATLAMVTPVAAQTTGSRLPGAKSAMVASYDYSVDDDPANARPTDEAASVGRTVARCVVQQRPGPVTDYLAARTEAARKVSFARVQPAISGCFEMAAGQSATRMSMSAASFQGALGEALIERRAALPLAAEEPSKVDTPYWLSDDTNQRIVQEMAVCLAARHPEQSLALVRSKVGGPEEAAAFSVLVPAMGSCLVKDATLRANRTGVRLALASAVYHRMVDASDGPASQVKK